ncbi:MAG: flavodoxin family protein [Clostridia bacterium]|nr:flavodoxin family protein [Clostridia bacterium]
MSRLIIYDLPEKLTTAENGDMLFYAKPMVKPCMGCFACWTKTPGECAIADRCRLIPSCCAKSEEMVLISPIVYGGYSENVKAVLDRFIPYVLPYFRIVNGEMHHKRRNKNKFKLTVCFYGECDSEEKLIAESLVKANAINFGAESLEVKFYDGPEGLRRDVF